MFLVVIGHFHPGTKTNGSICGFQLPHNNFQHSGFANPVSANQTDFFAFIDGFVEIMEQHLIRIGHGQVTDFQYHLTGARHIVHVQHHGFIALHGIQPFHPGELFFTASRLF